MVLNISFLKLRKASEQNKTTLFMYMQFHRSNRDFTLQIVNSYNKSTIRFHSCKIYKNS